MYDVIIIGGGVTALAAAMYSARFNLKTLVIAGQRGGTIILTDVVENYPGFIKLTGLELAQKLEEHALSYEQVKMVDEKALNAKKIGEKFVVETDEGMHEGKTLIIATGTEWKKLGIPGEKELTGRGVHYCALCQPPDELVVANSSIINVGNVTPMTKLLTADGTFQTVAGFSSRGYSGKLVHIKPRYFTDPVALTPEHPVLTIKVSHVIGNKHKDELKFGTPEWTEAKDVRKGDCVIYPIIQELEDKDLIRFSEVLDIQQGSEGMVSPHRKSHTAKDVRDAIKVTPEFMRLIGYYLAEGSASKHTLRFYFSSKEKTYVEDVSRILKDELGLDSRVDIIQGGSVAAVTLYSKIVADFFKALFGKYSYDKHIPHWMLLLPKEKQAELVKGAWRGDGTTREKDFTYVSSSPKLVYQLRDILLRLGIIPSIHKRGIRSLNKKPNKIQGRDISFKHDKYHVVVGGQFLEKMTQILDKGHPLLLKRKRFCKHAWMHNGMALLPIREVSESEYDGMVMSIAVDNNHSYVAKNFVVHNCDGAFYRNKTVGVVGGSDSAVKEALLLAQHCSKVYILYRGGKVHPEPINLKRMEGNSKIEVINHVNVKEVKMDSKGKFSHLLLDKEVNGSKEFKVDGLFIEIGHNAQSELAKQLGVELNEKQEIIIDKYSKTNVQGVFAAGDVCDTRFKQAITGVSEGVTASYSAFQFLGGEA